MEVEFPSQFCIDQYGGGFPCHQWTLVTSLPVRRFFSSVFQEKFKTLYYPRKEINIDESMITFKGRLNFKLRMPLKPVKKNQKDQVMKKISRLLYSEHLVIASISSRCNIHSLCY